MASITMLERRVSFWLGGFRAVGGGGVGAAVLVWRGGFRRDGWGGIREGWQRLVLHAHPLGRVACLRERVGDNEGDRLADKAGAVDGERVLVRRLDRLPIRVFEPDVGR